MTTEQINEIVKKYGKYRLLIEEAVKHVFEKTGGHLCTVNISLEDGKYKSTIEWKDKSGKIRATVGRDLYLKYSIEDAVAGFAYDFCSEVLSND